MELMRQIILNDTVKTENLEIASILLMPDLNSFQQSSVSFLSNILLTQ